MKPYSEKTFECPKCSADVPVDIDNIEYHVDQATAKLKETMKLDAKFYKLAVLERDAAWREIELLKTELKILKA